MCWTGTLIWFKQTNEQISLTCISFPFRVYHKTTTKSRHWVVHFTHMSYPLYRRLFLWPPRRSGGWRPPQCPRPHPTPPCSTKCPLLALVKYNACILTHVSISLTFMWRTYQIDCLFISDSSHSHSSYSFRTSSLSVRNSSTFINKLLITTVCNIF